MKNRIFFLLLFFVCLEWNAYAVIDIQSIHITSSDGLANNTIRDIFQDKKGFIWISTTNGLSRYDGHSFITLLPEKDSPIIMSRRLMKIKMVFYGCFLLQMYSVAMI